MPKLRSARKRLRQNQKRQLANKTRKNAIKALKRKIKKALAQGKSQKETFDTLVNQFYKAVDKAAKTNTIHKNKANREKSRLAVFIAKHSASSQTKPTKPKGARKTAKAKIPRAIRKKGSRRKAK